MKLEHFWVVERVFPLLEHEQAAAGQQPAVDLEETAELLVQEPQATVQFPEGHLDQRQRPSGGGQQHRVLLPGLMPLRGQRQGQRPGRRAGPEIPAFAVRHFDAINDHQPPAFVRSAHIFEDDAHGAKEV